MSERKVKVLKVKRYTARDIAEMAPVDSLETAQEPAVYCEIAEVKAKLRRLSQLHHISSEKAHLIIDLLF
jgi:hypothetical protein